MSKMVLVIILTLLTVFQPPYSELTPTNSNNKLGGQQTPAQILYPINGISPHDRNDDQSRIINQPPELPIDHPIRPQPLPVV